MPERDKTANWISTVAGVLSVHSKKIFKSGQSLFNETGWWALQEVYPPNMKDVDTYKIHRIYTKKTDNTSQYKPEKLKLYGRGKRQRKENKFHDEIDDVPKKIRYNKNKKIINTVSDDEKTEIKQESLPDKNDTPMLDDVTNIQIKTEPLDDIDWEKNMETELSLFDKNISDDIISSSDVIFDPINEVLASNVLNNSECPSPATPATPEVPENHFVGSKTLKQEDFSCNVSSSATPSVVAKPTGQKMVFLTPNEENEFLSCINSCENALESDASVRRLRRKLSIRKYKREIGMEVWNFDELVTKLIKKSLPKSFQFLISDSTLSETSLGKDILSAKPYSEQNYINHPALKGINILDRFVKYEPSKFKSNPAQKSFIQLVGLSKNNVEPEPIISPYTSRVLKPFIRRDFETKPLKLRLLNKICSVVKRNNLDVQSPIDYCYVQPNHIPAVNTLCSEFFWPGIDLTECLQYPEFSCVVLYKKLLIGCAFMVPDVNYNEAYISFILVHPDWRGAGIGTYMIYHLIQTCMGKDITLHVSPSNPSMLLYQKFGFKNEELILDFYEKYIPADQKGSRHAFFLRLQR